MRKWQEIIYAVFMGMVVPWLVVSVAVIRMEGRAPEAEETEQRSGTVTGEARASMKALVRREDGSVEEWDMDEYLTGVVLGEMPAFFEPEALKAQAVAARTYAAKAKMTGGKHGDGSVCMDSQCCQAYQDPGDYISSGGTAEDVAKIRQAVEDTSGYVLTYGGELIEAVYFSCSGGSTEDAAAVWGTEVPYLQATDSPGEENAVHNADSVTFTADQFQQALGKSLSGDPETWFGEVTYTDGGGVAEMEIGGEIYTGVRLRQLLGLRSTAFTVTAEGGSVRIETRGYGHRVGMSQYGADAMAASGSTFREILSHYYRGTTLEIWENSTE